MPEVAAIALDVRNPTAPVCLFLFVFAVLLDLSCWTCVWLTGTGLYCPVSVGIWPAWISLTVSFADISVRGLETLLAFAVAFEQVSMSYFGSEGLSLWGFPLGMH